MATISGEFRLAEAGDVSRVLTRRLLGWRRYTPWAALAIFFVSLILTTAVLDAVAPPDVRTSAMIAVVGTLCVLAYYLWAWWWRGVVLRAWRRRGVPDPMPLSVETTGEAVLFSLGAVTMRIPWTEVSELTRSRTRWVFMANYSAVGVPRRLFPNPQAERAFVADALARISPEARTRSRDAAAFAVGTL